MYYYDPTWRCGDLAERQQTRRGRNYHPRTHANAAAAAAAAVTQRQQSPPPPLTIGGVAAGRVGGVGCGLRLKLESVLKVKQWGRRRRAAGEAASCRLRRISELRLCIVSFDRRSCLSPFLKT